MNNEQTKTSKKSKTKHQSNYMNLQGEDYEQKIQIFDSASCTCHDTQCVCTIQCKS